MRLVMIGGSDAGISAALRARELDPAADVTVVAADAYPNFSICGIPYYVSGEVSHWRNLAHRTLAGDVVGDAADGEVRVGIGQHYGDLRGRVHLAGPQRRADARVTSADHDQVHGRLPLAS